MLALGFDTSNYATSLAVYDTCSKEVVCDKKKFLPVRPGQLGLRQSDARRPGERHRAARISLLLDHATKNGGQG